MQSQKSINKFVSIMVKNNIPTYRWNEINAENKRLKKLSNIVGFAVSTEVAASALFSLCISLLLRLLQIVLNSSFAHDMLQNTDSVFYYSIYLSVYIIQMFIPLMILTFCLKQNIFSDVLSKPVGQPSKILPAVIISLGVYYIGTVLTNILQMLLETVRLKPVEPDFSAPSNTAAFVVYAFMICICAPIFEELIFRGLILQSLRKYGNYFAIIISAMAFALMHGNLVQAPYAFITGLALGFFVIKLGSIWAGIIIHCSINSISVIMEEVSKKIGDNLTTLIYTGLFWLVLMLGAAVIAIYKVDLRLPRKNDNQMPNEVKVKSFFLTPGFIVFVVISLILLIMNFKVV